MNMKKNMETIFHAITFKNHLLDAESAAAKDHMKFNYRANYSWLGSIITIMVILVLFFGASWLGLLG